jgi:signal peptidase I
LHISVDDWQFAVILLGTLLGLRLCLLFVERAYTRAARASLDVAGAAMPDYLDDVLDLIAVLALGFGGILAERVFAAFSPLAAPGTGWLALHWSLQRLVLLCALMPFVFARVVWDLSRLRDGRALWVLTLHEREVGRALALTVVALFAIADQPWFIIHEMAGLTRVAALLVLIARLAWVPVRRALIVTPPDHESAVEEDDSISIFLAGVSGLLFLLGMAGWITSDGLRLGLTLVAFALYVPHVIWLLFREQPIVEAPTQPLAVAEDDPEEGVYDLGDAEEALAAQLTDDAEVAAPAPEAEPVMILFAVDGAPLLVPMAADAEAEAIADVSLADDAAVDRAAFDDGGCAEEEPDAPAPAAAIHFHGPYRFWTELLDSAIVAVFLVFLLIRPFLLQAFFIPSGSMRPTLVEGDKLLATKVTYWMHSPRRGDICVFTAPAIALSTLGQAENAAVPMEYVKRIIGVPGDRLRVAKGDGVYINGEKLNEPYLTEPYQLVDYNFPNEPDGSPPVFMQEHPEVWQSLAPYVHNGELWIPPDTLFVMGDNRTSSHDSHRWGLLQRSAVRGQAFFIFWPSVRLGLLH